MDNSITDSERLIRQASQIANLIDLGITPSVDPDLADHMGSFEEAALSPEDAIESIFDDPEDQEGQS